MINIDDSDNVMEAEQILIELHKLIAREKTQKNPEQGISSLEDAADNLNTFLSSVRDQEASPNKFEKQSEDISDQSEPSGLVDTGVLTGPINSLRNFLVKKSQDNDQI